MLQLHDWFIAIEATAANSNEEDEGGGFGVVCWGRMRDTAVGEGEKAALKPYDMDERLSDTTFLLKDGRTVELVGPSDIRRAASAGVPLPFINAFRKGIPPAYEMLVGVAESVLSLATPPSPLVLPGSSLPPSPVRIPPLPTTTATNSAAQGPPPTIEKEIEETHEVEEQEEEKEEADDTLPKSLFEMGTAFTRKENEDLPATKTKLYSALVAARDEEAAALRVGDLPTNGVQDKDKDAETAEEEGEKAEDTTIEVEMAEEEEEAPSLEEPTVELDPAEVSGNIAQEEEPVVDEKEKEKEASEGEVEAEQVVQSELCSRAESMQLGEDGEDEISAKELLVETDKEMDIDGSTSHKTPPPSTPPPSLRIHPSPSVIAPFTSNSISNPAPIPSSTPTLTYQTPQKQHSLQQQTYETPTGLADLSLGDIYQDSDDGDEDDEDEVMKDVGNMNGNGKKSSFVDELVDFVKNDTEGLGSVHVEEAVEVEEIEEAEKEVEEEVARMEVEKATAVVEVEVDVEAGVEVPEAAAVETAVAESTPQSTEEPEAPFALPEPADSPSDPEQENDTALATIEAEVEEERSQSPVQPELEAEIPAPAIEVEVEVDQERVESSEVAEEVLRGSSMEVEGQLLQEEVSLVDKVTLVEEEEEKEPELADEERENNAMATDPGLDTGSPAEEEAIEEETVEEVESLKITPSTSTQVAEPPQPPLTWAPPKPPRRSTTALSSPAIPTPEPSPPPPAASSSQIQSQPQPQSQSQSQSQPRPRPRKSYTTFEVEIIVPARRRLSKAPAPKVEEASLVVDDRVAPVTPTSPSDSAPPQSDSHSQPAPTRRTRASIAAANPEGTSDVEVPVDTADEGSSASVVATSLPPSSVRRSSRFEIKSSPPPDDSATPVASTSAAVDMEVAPILPPSSPVRASRRLSKQTPLEEEEDETSAHVPVTPRRRGRPSKGKPEVTEPSSSVRRSTRSSRRDEMEEEEEKLPEEEVEEEQVVEQVAEEEDDNVAHPAAESDPAQPDSNRSVSPPLPPPKKRGRGRPSKKGKEVVREETAEAEHSGGAEDADIAAPQEELEQTFQDDPFVHDYSFKVGPEFDEDEDDPMDGVQTGSSVEAQAPPSPPSPPTQEFPTASTSQPRRKTPLPRRLSKAPSTISSTPATASAAFVNRPRQAGRQRSMSSVAASPAPSEASASNGRERPARQRKSAANWWHIGTALSSLAAQKKRARSSLPNEIVALPEPTAPESDADSDESMTLGPVPKRQKVVKKSKKKAPPRIEEEDESEAESEPVRPVAKRGRPRSQHA